jgi:hypothetical protein
MACWARSSFRGDMYTKSEEWVVLEDLKKNNAK